MKYVGKILTEDQDQAELLEGILLPEQVNHFKKLVHSVHQSAPFHLK